MKQGLGWTSSHHTTFVTLKIDLLQAPILCYPDPWTHYIVYSNASDDACLVQLSQEHDGQELTVAFISHTLTDTQWKWSITEQEAYGIDYSLHDEDQGYCDW